MTLEGYREMLREKIKADVKQIRLTTALALLPEETPGERLSRLDAERIFADLATSKPRAIPTDDSPKPVQVAGLLVGTAEAAALLGVERPRIGRYRKQGKMPPSVAELAAGPVWLRTDVEEMRHGIDERRKPRRGPGEAGPGRPGNQKREKAPV